MSDERQQAVDWLEEMGFVLPASVQTSPAADEDPASVLARLARVLAEQRDQLKVRFNALRERRVA